MTRSRLPSTSTTTVSVGPPRSVSTGPAEDGGISLRNSVSIHWVCTANSPASATNAGSVTTARWNGMVVGSPSAWNSASARRARCSACVRSRPVTTSLASSESNSGPTTLPGSTPESTRTPGPAGGRHAVSAPGAGRKARPGSSPLIRNSSEWPRTGGSS